MQLLQLHLDLRLFNQFLLPLPLEVFTNTRNLYPSALMNRSEYHQFNFRPTKIGFHRVPLPLHFPTQLPILIMQVLTVQILLIQIQESVLVQTISQPLVLQPHQTTKTRNRIQVPIPISISMSLAHLVPLRSENPILQTMKLHLISELGKMDLIQALQRILIWILRKLEERL